ncbi:UNVERIFIED_CONTAM: SAG-related sequence SRS48E [Hammondia hammondi]|eukprot:XP_008888986.1 SAG-related sequence SRS48E [Hammondia hammondi]
MVGRVSGAVFGVRGLRSAVGAAMVIGLLCLSRSGTATEGTNDDVFTCSAKNQSVVSLKVKDKSQPIKFACPKDFDVFPPVADQSNQFCRDSLCTHQAPLAPAFTIERTDAEATEDEDERSRQDSEGKQELSTVYKLTMQQQETTSSTLYFQCRKKDAESLSPADAVVETKPGKLNNDKIRCAFQVAAYGSTAAAAEAPEKEPLGVRLLSMELFIDLWTAPTRFDTNAT